MLQKRLEVEDLIPASVQRHIAQAVGEVSVPSQKATHEYRRQPRRRATAYETPARYYATLASVLRTGADLLLDSAAV